MIPEEEERRRFINFINSMGAQYTSSHPASFSWEATRLTLRRTRRPQIPVTVTRFYMSRSPVTNEQYEAFDPSHARKRAAGAGNNHPVVYVSSPEAMKFCQWLSTRERRKYRLPTEAEVGIRSAKEKTAGCIHGGNHARRGDLANFADKNTVFAWSDRDIDDGYAESSPVGAFPRGASPFGIEDMAGNVWEWCSDYFEAVSRLCRR